MRARLDISSVRQYLQQRVQQQRADAAAANRPLFLRPIDRTALHEANYEEPINWPAAGFHPHTGSTVCLPPRQTASLPLAH